MPIFRRDQVNIHYEIKGDGFPILVFAPGGMLSAASFWENAEWDPIKTLSPHFTVITMDQRNAGSSRAPVSGSDGWHSYAEDHLALLDHLNIDHLCSLNKVSNEIDIFCFEAIGRSNGKL